MSSDTEFALHRQTEAARELLATISGEGAGDDVDLILTLSLGCRDAKAP